MTNEEKVLVIIRNHKKSSIEGLEISTGLKKGQVLRACVKLKQAGILKFQKGRIIKDQYGFSVFDKKYRGVKLLKKCMWKNQKLFDYAIL